jgi:hypothetical protein
VDRDSVGYYKNIADEKKELERKVRTVSRGISVLGRNLAMLNPLKYGLFSWQLFSHKLCRWLVPFAMILVFVTNTFLISFSNFYLYAFILQMVFYTIALMGTLSSVRTKRIVKIPSFLVLVNLSILIAWYQYFKGKRLITWEPSKR